MAASVRVVSTSSRPAPTDVGPDLRLTPLLPEPIERPNPKKKSSAGPNTPTTTLDHVVKRRNNQQLKEMTKFIRRLKKLNPNMVYADLVRNVGTTRLGLLQWFKLAANHLLEGNIKPLHAQHRKWVERNRDTLKQLTNNIPSKDKLALVMKKGGQGFFGGVLIRILVRWKERLQQSRRKIKKYK